MVNQERAMTGRDYMRIEGKELKRYRLRYYGEFLGSYETAKAASMRANRMMSFL
jgi:hypothetical protein